MLGESYTFYANLSYQTTKSCHKIATVLLISIAKEYLQVKKKKIRIALHERARK